MLTHARTRMILVASSTLATALWTVLETALRKR